MSPRMSSWPAVWLLSRGELKFHHPGAFGAGRLELPFFHCIYRGSHKNRVTTDYFGFLDGAIRGHEQLQFDGPRDPHLSRDLGIYRRHSSLYLAIEAVLGKSRLRTKDYPGAS